MKLRKILLGGTFSLLVAINIIVFNTKLIALKWDCSSTFKTVAIYHGGRYTNGCRQTVMCNDALWSETVFYVYDGYNEWENASVAGWCK